MGHRGPRVGHGRSSATYVWVVIGLYAALAVALLTVF
jgi:hypothetical protein